MRSPSVSIAVALAVSAAAVATAAPGVEVGRDLVEAAALGDVGRVEVLLASGADPNGRYGDISPLAVAAGLGSLSVARFLPEHGASASASGNEALMYACYSADQDMVSLLLGSGAGFLGQAEHPLHLLALERPPWALALALAFLGISVPNLDWLSGMDEEAIRSVFLQADSEPYLRVARIALGHGLRPDALDQNAKTALDIALAEPKPGLEMAKLLLEALSEGQARSVYERRTLFASIATGDTNVLAGLLDRRPSLAREPSGDGTPPVVQAAAYARIEQVRILLDGGADPLSVDAQGRTALVAASEAGDDRVARLILNVADAAALARLDPSGRAVRAAGLGNNPGLLGLLLDRGQPVTDEALDAIAEHLVVGAQGGGLSDEQVRIAALLHRHGHRVNCGGQPSTLELVSAAETIGPRVRARSHAIVSPAALTTGTRSPPLQAFAAAVRQRPELTVRFDTTPRLLVGLPYGGQGTGGLDTPVGRLTYTLDLGGNYDPVALRSGYGTMWDEAWVNVSAGDWVGAGARGWNGIWPHLALGARAVVRLSVDFEIPGCPTDVCYPAVEIRNGWTSTVRIIVTSGSVPHTLAPGERVMVSRSGGAVRVSAVAAGTDPPEVSFAVRYNIGPDLPDVNTLLTHTADRRIELYERLYQAMPRPTEDMRTGSLPGVAEWRIRQSRRPRYPRSGSCCPRRRWSLATRATWCGP